MSVYKKNNKFISYLLVLLSLFVLILFTKDQIVLMQENKDLKETYNNELNTKNLKINELNKLKTELVNSGENINKYDLEIKEDELIDYIYSYVEEVNSGTGVVIIKNLSIGDAKDTEIGFKESSINLSLKVPSEDKLIEVLDFLTSDDSKYNFFIDSFSFPYGEEINGNFSVSIPLKVLFINKKK